MARPSKDFRIKRTRDGLQVYDQYGYIAELSSAEILLFARTKQTVGRKRVMAGLTLIKGGVDIDG